MKTGSKKLIITHAPARPSIVRDRRAYRSPHKVWALFISIRGIKYGWKQLIIGGKKHSENKR
jgi:hypothetical protein